MTPSDRPELKRTLGLFACTVMGVGVILGAGIYTLVGKAAGLAGNAVWASFLGAAVLAALTGLSYAELSSFIPRAGGVYYYVHRAFGECVAFLVAWLLFAGIAVLVAAVALGFAGYLSALAGAPLIVSALALLALTSGVLVFGVRESAWFAGICTALEVLGLVVVIWIGLPHLGTVDLLEAPNGWRGVASAASLIFFAYIGFEEIVQLAEETREPTRNIPRALVISIAATTVLYVLVAITAVSVVGWQQLGASESPLADVAGAKLGNGLSVGIAVIALFSTANTVLVLMLSESRLLYGAAQDGALPAVLARVHRTRHTPWVATLTTAGVAALFLSSLGRIEVVATVGNFALFVTFVFINGAVIVLRLREPDTPRPFRIAGSLGRVPVLPVLGVLSALAMMTRTSLLAAAMGAGILAVGLLVRCWMRRGHAEPESKT